MAKVTLELIYLERLLKNQIMIMKMIKSGFGRGVATENYEFAIDQTEKTLGGEYDPRTTP